MCGDVQRDVRLIFPMDPGFSMGVESVRRLSRITRIVLRFAAENDGREALRSAA